MPAADVDVAVGGGGDPYGDVPAGPGVADRVGPGLAAGAGVEGAQPRVLPHVHRAVVQDRGGFRGLEVTLGAGQLPQLLAVRGLPSLDAAAAGGGDDGAPLGAQGVHPGVGGQPPAFGAVGGVERVEGGAVGGVDAAVGDGHGPGHVAGLELAAAAGHVQGVHLEGGDVEQVPGDGGGAPDLVGHAEAPRAPAAAVRGGAGARHGRAGGGSGDGRGGRAARGADPAGRRVGGAVSGGGRGGGARAGPDRHRGAAEADGVAGVDRGHGRVLRALRHGLARTRVQPGVDAALAAVRGRAGERSAGSRAGAGARAGRGAGRGHHGCGGVRFPARRASIIATARPGSHAEAVPLSSSPSNRWGASWAWRSAGVGRRVASICMQESISGRSSSGSPSRLGPSRSSMKTVSTGLAPL